MTNIFKPPMNITKRNRRQKSVFLAGSIEMGVAENWQDKFSTYFTKNDWIVLNPRREEWDSSWVQEFETPQFFQQVSWELNALEESDLIVMYFDPKTKSPISLLELGLFAKSGKLHVICPDGFWRKGNVEIVCQFYNTPFYDDVEEFWKHFRQIPNKK